MNARRYETMFASLAQQGRGAFVPFVVIGDPNLEQSLDCIRALVEGGADALELGIPFSDPIADGPTNQAAMVRALAAGVTPPDCFGLLRRVRDEFPETPIGLLVYANLLAAPGPDRFYQWTAEAGVDAVLVADVPTAEGAPFCEAAARHGVQPVFIAPPHATEAQLRAVARLSQGYTYVVARGGVTGVDDELRVTTREILRQLRDWGAPPALLGFGISRPEHVRVALEAGAAGAISGSAVVRLVEQQAQDQRKLHQELSKFVAAMRAATVMHSVS